MSADDAHRAPPMRPSSAPADLNQAGLAQAQRRKAILAGIGFMMLGVLLFTGMDAIVKHVADHVPIGQIVFFRNLFAFIPVAIMVHRAGGVRVLKTGNLKGHLTRALFGISAMTCFFLSYKLLPLGEAIALGMSAPLLMTALSVPFLGEKVGPRRWAAVAVGFVGVLAMTRPGVGVFDPAALVPLAAALFYAAAMISIRKLSRSENNVAMVFYFTLFATAISAASLPFAAVWPTGPELAWLIGIGIIGGSAQFMITQAFRLAPVSILAPFDYLALVYAMGLGYVFWNEIPDRYILLGAAIVVASGLYILHREAKLGRRAVRDEAIHS